MKTVQLTEFEIQVALYKKLRYGRSMWPIYHNIDQITGYEADLLAISKAGYASEYEIKLSLTDFRADLRKKEKHASLSGQCREVEWNWRHGIMGAPIMRTAVVPNDVADTIEREGRPDGNRTPRKCHPELRPKFFWYVTYGFDPVDGIPDYAGHIEAEVSQYGRIRFHTLKKAPQLECQKVPPARLKRAQVGVLYRYWDLKTRIDRDRYELARCERAKELRKAWPDEKT